MVRVKQKKIINKTLNDELCHTYVKVFEIDGERYIEIERFSLAKIKYMHGVVRKWKNYYVTHNDMIFRSATFMSVCQWFFVNLSKRTKKFNSKKV